MAGRINDEDIALVRERARIDDVIRDYVALRPAGGGSFKGLCPFHDEKTPSFTVSPVRGFFHCFGCGEGGDVITFLQRQQNLGFVEAVQVLADRYGVTLRTVDDGDGTGPSPGLRKRVLEANEAAQGFFAEQLSSPEAITARQFLNQRGFTREHAEHFALGYAPRGGSALRQHLRRAGFEDEVLKAAGLMRDGGRDFFVGRLLWPIRDSASAVLGFGARRIHDDDRLPAKYINTPETPVYKKSQVLYGLDLARRAIGKRGQAVIVEGYTDVMAAHISGVDTAVASCGTAFGADHARRLQRLLGTRDGGHAEVIFTFDGDEAGQKAALKAYDIDKELSAQTYVAVEPSGLDPCDLWLRDGQAAVRELVARRIPLYRFVMAHIVGSYDLDHADGRLNALRQAAPLAASIRDRSRVEIFERDLAAATGMDLAAVRREVARAAKGQRATMPAPAEPTVEASPWPSPADPRYRLERDTIKLLLQQPFAFDASWNSLREEEFEHPAYAEAFRLLAPLEPSDTWTRDLVAAAPTAEAAAFLRMLSLEPLYRSDPDERYVLEHTDRLHLVALDRRITAHKARIQRLNAVEREAEHQEMFTELMGLELERKRLLEGLERS